MGSPYVGEIRMVGFNFAPQGWAFCNGQVMSIADNATLFNLIGTTYGGDGVSTFDLPNLQCRIPFHQGSDAMGDTMVIGQLAGSEQVTLITSQLPVHSHVLAASNTTGNQPSPAGGVWAASSLDLYSTDAPTLAMSTTTTLPTGGSQPHDNVPPYQVINFIISLYGIYPSQN